MAGRSGCKHKLPIGPVKRIGLGGIDPHDGHPAEEKRLGDMMEI